MECGAIFDMRKNPKNANKKAALKRGGSDNNSHASEILQRVGMSKVPLGIGLNLELMVRLRRYKVTV